MALPERTNTERGIQNVRVTRQGKTDLDTDKQTAANDNRHVHAVPESSSTEPAAADSTTPVYDTVYDQSYSGIKNTQVIRAKKDENETAARKRKRRIRSLIASPQKAIRMAKTVAANNPNLTAQIKRRARVVRLAANAWWFWIIIFCVQMTGGMIALAGLLGLASADFIPLLGDIVATLTDIDELIVIGGMIAVTAGSFGYVLIVVICLLSRVNIFTWPIGLSFAVTFALHTIPVVNLFVPLFAVWLGHILIAPLLHQRTSS